MVRPRGFEPLTFCSGGRRSIRAELRAHKQRPTDDAGRTGTLNSLSLRGTRWSERRLQYTETLRGIMARTSKLWRLAIALPLLATALPAHHSFGAEYDATKPVTLTGVITKIDWTNPHSYFFLDVKDAKGNVANWKFEGYPPSVLVRTGWKKDVTMKVGDTVTVFGWHARDGTNWAHSREVTLANGKKLFFGPPAGTGDGGNTPGVDVK